jgi:FkbM family methyltransferase
MPVSAEAVTWAYRLLLGRDPESEQVIREKMGACPNLEVLRDSLMASEEYKKAQTIEGGSSEVIFVDDEGDRFFVDLNDHAIGRQIMAGCYEPAVLNCIRKLVKEGHTCIDVGANIGYFTIKMARLGAQVLSLEPVSYLYKRLSKGVKENERLCTSNYDAWGAAHPRQFAAGSEDGDMVMVHAPATINQGGAYLMPEGTEAPPNHVAESTIVVKLDQFLETWPTLFLKGIRLIKMDVEGAEPLVALGAWEAIKKWKPAIIAEIHRSQYMTVSKTTPEEFVDRFRQLGYQAYFLHGENDVVEFLRTDPLPDYDNILLVAD